MPIAVGLLMASEQLIADLSRALIIGELSLNGAVRHTNGVLPMAELAREKGFDTLFVPASDAPEAALVPDLNVFPIETLFALVAHLNTLCRLTQSVFSSSPPEHRILFIDTLRV